MYSIIRNICFGMGLMVLASFLPANANEIPKDIVQSQNNQEVAVRWGVGFYGGYGPYFYVGPRYRHSYYYYSPYRYRYYYPYYNYYYRYPYRYQYRYYW